MTVTPRTAGGYGFAVPEYLVVTNAAAGSNDEARLETALDVLRAAGPVVVVATSSAEQLDDVLSGTTATVVIAGGDGTLNAVVNAVRRLALNVPLGLIPMGTGNDFARGAGVPLQPEEAAHVIVDRRRQPVDLMVTPDGIAVVNSVHLGVGAQASHAARAFKPVLGRLGYAMGTMVAGLRPSSLHVKVTVDGVTVTQTKERLAQVAVGNGPSVGGGTELIPDADPGDGLLDVMVVRAVGRLPRLAYVIQLRLGRHTERPDVTHLRGKEVRIEGKPFRLSADGELSGPHTRASWRLVPGAIQMHR